MQLASSCPAAILENEEPVEPQMSPMSFSDSNSESIHIHGRHMNQQCDPTVSTDWSTLDEQIITLQEKQNKNNFIKVCKN